MEPTTCFRWRWETSIFQKKCRNLGRDNLSRLSCSDALFAPVMGHKLRLGLDTKRAFIAEFSPTFERRLSVYSRNSR